MSENHKSLRIGDLLVEKRLISAAQLRQAIEIQQFRSREKHEQFVRRYELGEILIELGFISRHQLNANLSWQRRLKATTAMMVFVAPLLTAACGGGGGGSGGGGSVSQPAANTVAQVTPGTTEKPAEALQTSSSSSTPSVPMFASSSSKSSVSSSVASSTSLGNVASIDGAAQLLWTIPTSRANGEFLDVTEIGGYEIRYKLKADESYTSIVVNDGFTDAYYFNYLKGEYEFEIATFDKDGLYSDFVSIDPS